MSRISLRLSVCMIMVSVLAAVCAPDSYARKIKTSHKTAKTSSQSAVLSDPPTLTVYADTTPDWGVLAGKIRFSGFDKTPSSNKESFFITNSTDSIMKGLTVEIEYTDLKERLLHKRSVAIDCDIPPKDTRRVDVPTWDIQHAFRHYRCSPTKRPTTPFRVKIIPLSVVFNKE